MKKRPIGKTGLEVSEIGLGTWQFGGDAYGPVSDQDVEHVIRTAYVQEITFFDTADLYGDGRVESALGRLLHKIRDKVVLCSKAGNERFGPAGSAIRKNFKKDYLLTACEHSLKRLDTDHLDLYLLHNPSFESMRRGECFEALEQLARDGKVRAWGASVGTLEEARYAIARHAQALMLPYNLLQSSLVHAIVAEASARQVALLARSPLSYGMLAGIWQPGHRFTNGDHRARRWTPEAFTERLSRVEDLRFLAKAPIPSLAEAALRYVLANHAVACAVVGARTVAQIEAAARASSEPPYLTDADLRQVAAVAARWKT